MLDQYASFPSLLLCSISKGTLLCALNSFCVVSLKWQRKSKQLCIQNALLWWDFNSLSVSFCLFFFSCSFLSFVITETKDVYVQSDSQKVSFCAYLHITGSLLLCQWFVNNCFLCLSAYKVDYVCRWMCVFVSLLHYLGISLLSQQLLREMQQMASRPFATINVALETDEEPPDLIGGNVKVSVTF